MTVVNVLKIAALASVGAALIACPASAGEKGETAKPSVRAEGGGPGWEAKVAPNQPAPATQGSDSIALDDKQTKLVQKISAYFNDIKTLKGSFLQTSADDKRMKGKFYLVRPGRFRFDYALPSKQVIISDGTYLAIQDHDLNNEDRMELDSTPFRLVLRKEVDLLRDAKIKDVQETDGTAVLTIEDKDPNSPGRLRLTFATTPALEIKEWVTTDPQGFNTKVEVSELSRGEEIDASLFKIEAPAGRPIP